MAKSSKTTTKKKNPHAVALGKLGGGPIGGRARMAMLTPAERHEFAVSGVRARLALTSAQDRHALAVKAARTRWSKAKTKKKIRP